MGLNIILPVKTAFVFALGEAILGQPISRYPPKTSPAKTEGIINNRSAELTPKPTPPPKAGVTFSLKNKGDIIAAH